MRSRWLALVAFLLLILFISFRDKKRTLRNKLKYYGMMFVEGMVGGLIIDSIGVNAGFYSFPRQPIYSLDYWLIVIPCWGIFGMLLNCLWDWFGQDKFLRSMAVSIIPLFIFYEGTNFITHSWIYTSPFSVVVAGWIPLGWTFAGCNKRRRVVFKVESLVIEYKDNYLVSNCLNIVKWLLIIIMFPLLLVAVAKVMVDVVIMLREKSSIVAYKEYIKVRVSTWLAMS